MLVYLLLVKGAVFVETVVPRTCGAGAGHSKHG